MQLSLFPTRLHKVQNPFLFLSIFGRYIWIYGYTNILIFMKLNFICSYSTPLSLLFPPCIHIYCINLISQPWILLCHQRKSISSVEECTNPSSDIFPIKKEHFPGKCFLLECFQQRCFKRPDFQQLSTQCQHQYWYLLRHFIVSAGRGL